MDLFDAQLAQSLSHKPLADRMRPVSIDDIVGQEHLLGPGAVLRTLIEKDQLRSLIFWGAPGTGKTTIAATIAYTTGAVFKMISAVNTGVKEAREIITLARDELKFRSRRTILFVDEIHRFNKSQQDAFLPSVEDGTIILIGATTENPSFEVNSALLSRSHVFVLNGHTRESLQAIVDRALADVDRGLGSQNLSLSQPVRELLIEYANGDARALLNIFELASFLVSESGEVTKEILDKAVLHKALRYDKGGEEHYNVISAFIKSMRNSDANAALYWLARMIEAGESPLFIARRMVVFASEDVGLADAAALPLAVAVFAAVDSIGMPEGRIPLAHGVVYLARAPKNNTAYRGIEAALSDAKEFGNLPVPLHLRNAVTSLMKEIGYGTGYQYAHNFEEKKTDMECLPQELKDRRYLES